MVVIIAPDEAILLDEKIKRRAHVIAQMEQDGSVTLLKNRLGGEEKFDSFAAAEEVFLRFLSTTVS